MKIVAGNSNMPLARAVAGELGIALCRTSIRRFADGEIFVEIQENVRGEDMFVLQSTCMPTNDHLMELLVVLDALRRGSARRITAVMPYFGYARQDRKSGPRTPISAKLVANLLTEAGADRILTMDLHAMQIQGFFDIPTDNLYAAPLFKRDILACHPAGKTFFEDSASGSGSMAHLPSAIPSTIQPVVRPAIRDDLMIVSPDVGGVVRARQLAQRLNVDLAIIDKRRERAGVSEVMNLIGDVKGRYCILVDDIVDSGGSLCNAAEALRQNEAAGVEAYVTHGVLTGNACERIAASSITMLTLTDSIPTTPEQEKAGNIRRISTADLIARAIRAVADESSVSSLFD